MKKLYIFLIILLSLEFSYQFNTLPNKINVALKCFFDTQENINNLAEAIDMIWTQSGMINLLSAALKLGTIAEKCLKINIMDILKPFLPTSLNSEINKGIVLNKIQKAKAPILLRKFLYDTVEKSDIPKAKKECKEMTNATPYDKYKTICDLF